MKKKSSIEVKTTPFLEERLLESLAQVTQENPPAVIEVSETNGMKLVLKGSPEAAKRKAHDIVKEVERHGYQYLLCNA